jgi:hypothetical protein
MSGESVFMKFYDAVVVELVVADEALEVVAGVTDEVELVVAAEVETGDDAVVVVEAVEAELGVAKEVPEVVAGVTEEVELVVVAEVEADDDVEEELLEVVPVGFADSHLPPTGVMVVMNGVIQSSFPL